MNLADANPLGAELERQLLDHVGVAPAEASAADLMSGVAQLAREQLSQRWVAAQAAQRGSRRVYYLSMEFLMGRTLGNALAALELQGEAAAALGRTSEAPRGHRAARGRRRTGQRRPGPAGRLLPGFDGHARPALLRLRHPLRVRHVRAEHRRRPPGRASGLLAGRRLALGVSAPRRALPGALRRACRSQRRPGAVVPGRRGQRQGLRHGGAGSRHARVSARCACGAPPRRSTSTCTPSTAATMRVPPR